MVEISLYGSGEGPGWVTAPGYSTAAFRLQVPVSAFHSPDGDALRRDKGQALREMLRVVKPGGKVLVTELGMPPGRRPTLRQRLLLLWIPGFREGPPVGAVPSEATDVKLDWDAGETMFMLEFRRPLSMGTDAVA